MSTVEYESSALAKAEGAGARGWDVGSPYHPECPREFSVLLVDILGLPVRGRTQTGQVYEQFLGKVIRLTAGHQAKVEEKPEVRKAGGVYYTP